MNKLLAILLVSYLISDSLLAVGGYHHHNHRYHQRRRFVDLTHVIEEKMPIGTDIAPLEFGLVEKDEGYGLRSEYFDVMLAEKVGTHINAPRTYNKAPTSITVDEILLENLVHIPGVVIDLPAAFDGNDRTAVLTSDALRQWESDFGPIPSGAFVILRTGWNKFYRDTDKYFGKFEGEDQIMIPGFTVDSIEWLMSEREIVGVGTECFDIELPWKTKQAVKQILAAANKYSIVQLNDVDLLPLRGFELIIAPSKLHEGHGGHVRVYAVIHHEAISHDADNSQHHNQLQHHATHATTQMDEARNEASVTTSTTSKDFSTMEELEKSESEEVRVFVPNSAEAHHLSSSLGYILVIYAVLRIR